MTSPIRSTEGSGALKQPRRPVASIDIHTYPRHAVRHADRQPDAEDGNMAGRRFVLEVELATEEDAADPARAEPIGLRFDEHGRPALHGEPCQPLLAGAWVTRGPWRIRLAADADPADPAPGVSSSDPSDDSVDAAGNWASPELMIASPGRDRVRHLRWKLPVGDGSTVRIGRSRQGNDLILEDDHVSRHHLTVTVRNGRHVVEDAGSRWGTTLNGEPLNAPAELRHGDEVRFGKSIVRYISYWEVLSDAQPVRMSLSTPDETEAAAPVRAHTTRTTLIPPPGASELPPLRPRSSWPQPEAETLAPLWRRIGPWPYVLAGAAVALGVVFVVLLFG